MQNNYKMREREQNTKTRYQNDLGVAELRLWVMPKSLVQCWREQNDLGVSESWWVNVGINRSGAVVIGF